MQWRKTLYEWEWGEAFLLSSALPGIQLHSYAKTKVNGFTSYAKEMQFNYAPLWQVFSRNYIFWWVSLIEIWHKFVTIIFPFVDKSCQCEYQLYQWLNKMRLCSLCQFKNKIILLLSLYVQIVHAFGTWMQYREENIIQNHQLNVFEVKMNLKRIFLDCLWWSFHEEVTGMI